MYPAPGHWSALPERCANPWLVEKFDLVFFDGLALDRPPLPSLPPLVLEEIAELQGKDEEQAGVEPEVNTGHAG